VGKFFVRYIWAGIGQRVFGMTDPMSASVGKNPKKHEAVRRAFMDWAYDRKQTVIFGHLHSLEAGLCYYNTGSQVGEWVQGIEVTGDMQIKLKQFS
jgi:hypothetical protein